MTVPLLPGRRPALVVGHPGHELRVHRFIELAAPVVFVLTDGSGRTAKSRLPSTTRVLRAAGATCGGVYGQFTDAEVYERIRQGDPAPFVDVLHALADALAASEIDWVVADAIEGFNPSHDLCRYIVNGALALLHQRDRRMLPNFDFLLDGPPSACEPGRRAAAIQIDLDEAALARKLAAAHGYPELRGETESALARFGLAAFATEVLRPVVNLREGVDELDPDPPYYEQFGEQQVRAGFYDSVIRYRAHVRPFVQSLWRQAGVLAPASVTTILSSATGGAI